MIPPLPKVQQSFACSKDSFGVQSKNHRQVDTKIRPYIQETPYPNPD
jgi:hypothetical protein